MGVSVTGSDSGGAGNDRRAERASGAPREQYDEYGDPEDQPTTALRRPANPPGRDPGHSVPPTQAPPLPPNAPASRPPANYGPAPAGYVPTNPGYGPPNTGYGPQNTGYGPADPGYGPPSTGYRAANPAYGPPNPAYGSPNTGYGPASDPSTANRPPADPFGQATTALPRPPHPSTPPGGGYPSRSAPQYRGDVPPVGPSWAAPGPYATPPNNGRDQNYGRDQNNGRDQDVRRSPDRDAPADQRSRYEEQDTSDRAEYDSWADDAYDAPVLPEVRHQPPPRGSHLPPYQEPLADAVKPPSAGVRQPRKLTVTRVAALRSRELTTRGVQLFHKATTADGADKSGLTALTYAVMANYAVDAILAVALAGTLFFAAATAESTGRVLLYLVITVAPFAFIAPFIGPMLDRLQSGRRLALGLSSFGRALLAILMAFNFSHFNPWVIYPCALGNLVLSKAFGVLKSSLTPRVLPEQITLVKTNSRLTTFGMIAGGVAGLLAAGLSKVFGSPGALILMAACAVAGGVLCLRIPAWVESTEGEVPVKLADSAAKKGFPTIVVATLWANSVIRIETGFLALFIAFVVKSQYPQPAHSAFTQLLLLGVIGAAAGVGGFVGNTMGARFTLSAPEKISLFSLVAVVVATLIAVLVPGLATAAVVGFVGSTASSLAKVSLDSVIQHHLPEESRASGFGKSESVLQLGWVFGGVVGLLLGGVWSFGHANIYAIGFATITVILVLGLVQSWLAKSGKTLLPKLTGRRLRSPGVQHTDRLNRPATADGPQNGLPRTAPYSVGTPDGAFPTAAGGTPKAANKRRIRKAGKD